MAQERPIDAVWADVESKSGDEGYQCQEMRTHERGENVDASPHSE